MDDDSCVVDFKEIVPVDSDRNCIESADVQFSPYRVKVCILFSTLFLYYLHDLLSVHSLP